MKKSLLFILASLFAIFTLAGCADDSNSDSNSTSASVDKSMAGTYDVTFFGSQVTNVRNPGSLAGLADVFYISNDCKKAKELYPGVIGVGGKHNCTPDKQSKLLDGKVIISIDNNGTILITSRMQMEGGAVDLSASDKYQYTEYNPTKATSGKGVKGYNYDAATNKPSAKATEFPESPFSVTKQADGTLRIDMTLVGKVVSGVATVDAKNTILLKKVNDNTTKLENKIQQPFAN